jgi:hypothetical protein
MDIRSRAVESSHTQLHVFPYVSIDLERGTRRLIVYSKILDLLFHLTGRSNIDSIFVRMSSHSQRGDIWRWSMVRRDLRYVIDIRLARVSLWRFAGGLTPEP